MVSKYLKLDTRQRPKLLEWMESLPSPEPMEDEEDCCMSGQSFTFTYCPSGIGDVLYVTTIINGTEFSCGLSYDDDGELC